ncbi:hypothetical protein UFOVP972_269 [uncultured Caudovirales phage]|uniref:Uncharacterized protein n=1 Tax=uncultured Caudovirales phage TaxID=2100421 RepID=A0A6J5PZK9_9CAUD|nr:hypothetical protein UFOVP972_269 [uncultured Caudovirales phage]
MLSCKNCGIDYTINSISVKYINKDPIKYHSFCTECRKIKPCKNCGIDFKHKQNQTCSIKCANKLKEKTYMLTQGTKHNFCKNSKARHSFEEKMLSTYGINNVFQRDDVKQKISSTILSRYGVDNISKSEKIKNKKRETLSTTIQNNPEYFKQTWWTNHYRLIKELGYDPRLAVFGKASLESLEVFEPIIEYCTSLNIENTDIYIGKDDKNEYFINSNKSIYFYDFCIRSKKIIIEYHGIGFHANPNWEIDKLNNWKSAFSSESSTDNINKTKIKNNAALQKGFSLLEIWSTDSPQYNIDLCKKFIFNNI